MNGFWIRLTRVGVPNGDSAARTAAGHLQRPAGHRLREEERRGSGAAGHPPKEAERRSTHCRGHFLPMFTSATSFDPLLPGFPWLTEYYLVLPGFSLVLKFFFFCATRSGSVEFYLVLLKPEFLFLSLGLIG